VRPFGIRYYEITSDREVIRQAVRTLEKDVHATSTRTMGTNTYPKGFFFGWRQIGWIQTDSPWMDGWIITIVCKEAYYKSLIDQGEIPLVPSLEESISEKKEAVRTINMLYRRGTYEELRYGSSKIDVADIKPLGGQQEAIDKVAAVFKKKKFTKAFVHGPPGTGKSALGLLLAKEFGGHYCHTFDPTTPGDQIDTLFGYYKDSESETPLIIVLEEANLLIEKIHNRRVEQHIKMPIPVRDKTTWCTFLDDLVFYKNVILILTSNQSKQEIDALDVAYLRPGRVDLVLEMKEVIHDS
jgi:SpoVK/Ycf46/Vps4 family AAA+-type ATPase